MSGGETLWGASARGRRLVVWAVGCLGVSSVVVQLVLMREMLSSFSGNEMVLGVILGTWLLLTGIGSWLGKAAARFRNAAGMLVLAELLVALVPLGQVFALRTLRDAVFVRGATVGVTETVLASFVLLWPYCLISGCVLTLACWALGSREGPQGIGRVYLADSIGSIVGGVLFTFVLVRWLDHLAALYVPALANLLAACLVAWHFRRQLLLAVTAAAIAGLVALAATVDLDALSTSLQYPSQRIVYRGNSPYGRLVVTESAGQDNFIENGLPIFSTDQIERVEETVHYAMAQRPDAQEVLLVGGGVSGTAREILKYGVREVTYVELDPLIIEVGRRFLPESLSDGRIQVVASDGRLFLQQTPRRFDVIIVDVPDPSTSQINRFYTAEFFAQAKARLTDAGVLSLGLGRYENYISPELARMLASAGGTLRQSFRNTLAIPGGRVFFLASDGPLHQDIAARIEQRGVQNKLVNRYYLDAMLTPDRLADVERAASRPAAVNSDFAPVLYYYHLRYWISQFKVGFGVLELALLALLALLAAYLVRMRSAAVAIFASGFAASALEVVLLLGVQALCGAVYHQVGVVVTAFMAGLAAGALVGNRRRSGSPRRDLAGLALAIAVYAALLPLLLMLLGRLAGAAGHALMVQAAIVVLTFVLAALVGMEFPLAGRAEFVEGAATASRLYTADFVGACLGALLASTLLIPLLGVTVACLAAAGLNVLGALAVMLRKG